MAKITLKGNPINTVGELPKVGTQAPDFTLVQADFSESSLNDYQGKRKILNIFPSIDTGVCASSVKEFNRVSNSLINTVILNISKDLPFAHGRFCHAEKLDNTVTLSAFRSSFGNDYQLAIADGPLKGLLSRAVIVLDENNKVIYTEQVPEIGQEPQYEQALKVL